MKQRATRLLHKYVLNPPIKWLFAIGVVPPGYAMLETIGRKSGEPRRTPVGDGLLDPSTFWIVAEHGAKAAYVRNLVANPRVRVQLRTGLRTTWRTGTAHLLTDDDPRERQRILSESSVHRRRNAIIVRALSTEMASVRIDLE